MRRRRKSLTVNGRGRGEKLLAVEWDWDVNVEIAALMPLVALKSLLLVCSHSLFGGALLVIRL